MAHQTGPISYWASAMNTVLVRKEEKLHASPIVARRRRRPGYHHLGGRHRLGPNPDRHASAHGRASCIHLRADAQPLLLWLLQPVLLWSLWPVLLRSEPGSAGR